MCPAFPIRSSNGRDRRCGHRAPDRARAGANEVVPRDGGLIAGASPQVHCVLHVGRQLRRRERGVFALLPRDPPARIFVNVPAWPGPFDMRSIVSLRFEETKQMFSVIFEVNPRPAQWDAYLDNAKMLRSGARADRRLRRQRPLQKPHPRGLDSVALRLARRESPSFDGAPG